MNLKLTAQLAYAIDDMESYIHSVDETELEVKAGIDRWSKKEILGHLVDSALNNIRRFTEVPFAEKPYIIHSYQQDNLVKFNAYQQMPVKQILSLWKELNHFVIYLINLQTHHTLAYPVILAKTQEQTTLQWLMDDYVVHLEGHCKQILAKS